MVRDAYTSVPKFSDADLGSGYAKKAKPGVNTISGLQSACTQADYSELLQLFCTQNTFGCNYKNCGIG